MFSIKKIVTLALMLTLLIISQLIAYPIPSLPNGLGNLFVLFEVFVIMFSFIFGLTKTLIVGAIYYAIIAWIGQPFFMREVTYVKELANIVGVYFLDYVIPFIFLSFSGVIYKKIPHYYVAILTIIFTVTCAYLSSVISGIIFWGAYSWTGWSIIAYSFGANSIRFSFLMLISIFLVTCTLSRLNIFLKQSLGENYARY